MQALASSAHHPPSADELRAWTLGKSSVKDQQEAIVLSQVAKQRLPHQLAEQQLGDLGIEPDADDHAATLAFQNHGVELGPYAHLAPLAEGAVSPHLHRIKRIAHDPSLAVSNKMGAEQANAREQANQLYLLKSRAPKLEDAEAKNRKKLSAFGKWVENFRGKIKAQMKVFTDQIAEWDKKGFAICISVSVSVKLIIIEVTGGITICIQPMEALRYSLAAKVAEQQKKHGAKAAEASIKAIKWPAGNGPAVSIVADACASVAPWDMGITIGTGVAFGVGE
eukprot:SAG31_NODE_2315_length_5951_cov_9.080472_2_plen_280_part_00